MELRLVYYQEPATTFFLLYALVSLIRAPSPIRVLLLAAAILIQARSLNYWTLHNSWFICLFAGAYAAAFWPDVQNLGTRLRGTRVRPATAVALSLCAVAAIVWVLLLLTVVLEQHGAYARGALQSTGFVLEDAYKRMGDSEVRRFTTELFNPWLQRPLLGYPIINEMHNARYLGAALVPLLLLFPVLRWRRTDLWLATVAVGLLLVALGSGVLLRLWAITPLMSEIQHQFYFNSHHLQLALVLIAARVLDRLLAGTMGIPMRRAAICVNGAAMALALLSLGVTFLFAEHFRPQDEVLASVNGVAVLVIVTGALVHQMLVRRSSSRFVFGLLLVVVLTGDLSRYFLVASKRDQAFTHHRRYGAVIPYPLPETISTTFKTPWVVRDPHRVDGGVFDNMPIESMFWPENHHIPSVLLNQWRMLPAAERARGAGRSPVAVVEKLQTLENQWVTGPESGEAIPGTADITRWGYNELRLESDAPRDGWVVLARLFDPYWRARVDGQDAELRRVDYRFLASRFPEGATSLSWRTDRSPARCTPGQYWC